MGLIPLVDPDCFQIEPERKDMAAIAKYPQVRREGERSRSTTSAISVGIPHGHLSCRRAIESLRASTVASRGGAPSHKSRPAQVVQVDLMIN